MNILLLRHHAYSLCATAITLLITSLNVHGACPTRIKTTGFPPIEWVIFDGVAGKELAQWSEPYNEIGYKFGPLPKVINSWEKAQEYCAIHGWESMNNGGYDCKSVKSQQPVLQAMHCHLGQISTTNNNSDIDTTTPPVPGCPKYLRKSLVSWDRKPDSNPQLNIWQIRNVSTRILKVTYRKDGSNNDSGTLNPGDSIEVWGLNQEPPYVVRDFKEITAFNSTHNATKELQLKSLQCDLAIRPR